MINTTDKLYMIPIEEATLDDWNRAFEERFQGGKFYSNSIPNGEKLRFYTLQARNQENAVYHFYKMMGCDPRFTDEHRDYLYSNSLSSNQPDIQLANGVTIEVKNFTYAFNPILRLRYKLWVPHDATEDDVRDLLWKNDFHNADKVIFVTQDCTKGCELTKNQIQFYNDPERKIRYDAMGKQIIYFFANTNGWFDLVSDRS